MQLASFTSILLAKVIYHTCCFTFQVGGGGVIDLDPKARERVIISKGGVLTDLHMHD